MLRSRSVRDIRSSPAIAISQRQVTEIGCPDCSGVLSQFKDGDGPHLRFVCKIGHAYSLYSLLQAKEEQLEHTLWSAISLFQHVEMLDELLLAHIDENGLATRTEGLAARLKQVRAQAARIRTVIEETASPDLDQEGDDSRADSP
jgi:two-component system, chemotaxis family, protein-glutamate methylesterase/glutaminase